jgi:uncharacterized repeat protein (TIGR01451 family)
MDETIESRLSFPEDGKKGHYYVERYDTTQTGRINVIYTTESNSLDVNCTNIKVLKIYCREMYEKKSEEVFKRDPSLGSNYYKTYFIDRDHFRVHIHTQRIITQLWFIDTPIPYNVTVNGQEWWLTGINYTYNYDGIVLTKVPKGHTYVDIYFQSKDLNSPVAKINVTKTVVGLGEEITFDGSESFDRDGNIIKYVWDLGQGTFKGGSSINHIYIQEGSYDVILTVKDDDDLIGRAYQRIVVVTRVMKIGIEVDKIIATPGSTLVYTITPEINTSWSSGVKNIVVKDTLPTSVEYKDSSPKPLIIDKNLTWKLGSAFSSKEIIPIVLKVTVNKDVLNNTNISNQVTLTYAGITNQQFPDEISNSVTTMIKVGNIQAPLILNRIPDVTMLEDGPPYNIFLESYEYDFTDSGIDLKWYLTGENESLYIISGEYSDTDIITIIPIPNANGNSLVTLWLEDSEGYTDFQPLWINITPVNDRPIFSEPPDLIIHYDSEYTFNYEPYIFDIDTPIEQLELFATDQIYDETTSDQKENETLEVKTNRHLEVDGFKVKYFYPESYVGEQIFVNLIVFDGESSDGDFVKVNVTDDYTPILRRELPDIWLYEGETKLNVFDLNEYFEDPDKDSLFYTYGETYVNVTINEDDKVDISSPSEWFGFDTITFRALDPVGAIAEDTIIVTVYPINDPPIIKGVPEEFVVHYNADYNFDLTPYISDTDNTTDELFLILSDKNIRTNPLNKLEIIMNYPVSMLGQEVLVHLVVSDGIDTGSQIITVKITDNWPPEINRELPNIVFNEDEVLINAFNLNDYFIDKDSTTLYYSYGHKNVLITIKNDGSVDFAAQNDWYGIDLATFRATDPTNAFKESVIEITVNPINDPPIIKPIPVFTGKIEELYRIDLTEYLVDVDNNITDLTISSNSDKIEIIISGRELVIYSDKPLIENISITVTDGLSETSGNFLIEIVGGNKKETTTNDFINFILWFLILFVIIILSIYVFTSIRRYVGSYKIEEIYWIHKSGLLISQVSVADVNRKKDREIVSGFLTGIIDFTKEAFLDDENLKGKDGIKEIQMGGKDLLIDNGKYTYLVTVFSGEPGKRLHSKSKRVVNRLELRYNKNLPNWDGNTNDMINSKCIINSILQIKDQNN